MASIHSIIVDENQYQVTDAMAQIAVYPRRICIDCGTETGVMQNIHGFLMSQHDYQLKPLDIKDYVTRGPHLK